MATRVKLLVGIGLSIALAAAVALPAAASASAQDQPAVNRVIVVLRNQLSGLPATPTGVTARSAAAARVQAPLDADLAASGAVDVHHYTLIDAVSATVSSSEEARLRANPAVSEVVPDQIIQLGSLFSAAGPAAGRTGAATQAAGVCTPADQVQLNPQALQLIHAASQDPSALTARKLGIDGHGVKVGFLADGLDINDPDFIRANGQHVFVDYKDFTGFGTGAPTGGGEAFGDAASVAAQGRQVYDVSGYGPDAVKTPCRMRIEGVASGASLVGLDVVASGGVDYNSTFLQGIDYAVTVDHVNVLNESLGVNNYPDDAASLDLVKAADEAAVAAGTTVTVSSGDAGVTDTIGTPASDPAVISAGATTSYRGFLQSGYGGAQFPGITGYLNDDISALSSSGFEQSGRTVDVVAPGELNWSLCSTNVTIYQDCTNYAGNPSPVQLFGGTSEAAPLTAGVAALVYQAYRKTHGRWPSPQVVKQIITGSAQDIGSPAQQQGSGLIDAYQAVLAAESYQSRARSSARKGATLLKSVSQLNAIAAPGSREHLTVRITNTGATTQRVAVSSRSIGPYTEIARTKVTLSDTSSPHTVDFEGNRCNYEKITFTVPRNEDRLSASLAFQNASTTDLDARVRLTLIDPSGRLAAYSLPQGDGNYGNVQVTRPLRGRWTAYIWSRDSSSGGTAGPVLFAAAAARYVRFGQVLPATLRLTPSQSARVTLSVTTPSVPGDAGGAVVLTSDRGATFGRQTTVPVTLRSVVSDRPTSFVQTLTGGNGRSNTTGQTFYYQVYVPRGRPELNATVTLANNPNNPFTMFLVSPDGQALGQGANELPTSTPPGYNNERGAQVHVLSPAPGRWTVIVAFVPQVSGTALTEPFTVSTSETAQSVSGTRLPDSSAVRLRAGTSYTYSIRVTNRSSAPAAYFVDPRLSANAKLRLVSLNDATATVPLTGSAILPLFLVPSHTSTITAAAHTTGATRIIVDSQAPAGDPDIGSGVGKTVAASLSAKAIAPGAWDVAPDVVGPFGSSGVASEPAVTAMTTVSSAFDPTVTSSTGDLWQGSVDRGALTGLSPVVVGAGQTGTITVTITPKRRSGTKAAGTLYVDVEDLFQFQVNSNVVNLNSGNPEPNASEVVAIPYRYTIT